MVGVSLVESYSLLAWQLLDLLDLNITSCEAALVEITTDSKRRETTNM